MSTKPLTPQTIQDIPFPTMQPGITSPYSQGGNNIYTPQTISDTPLPNPVVASQLVSDTLNTQARKILAEFNFGQSGAIKIGNYKNGSTGEVDISPNGILGRDSSGSATFFLDSITGDAIFKGTILAGSVIATTISATQLTAGTIDASVINITNLNASNITTGTLSASKIHGGTLQLGGSGNGNGLLQLLNGSNTEIVELNNGGIRIAGNSTLSFFSSIGGTLYGIIGPDTGNNLLEIASSNGKDIAIYADHNLFLLPNAGTVSISGSLVATGSKSAILKTSQGVRKVYCTEAPEAWFFDLIENPEKENVDPLFLEITEGPLKSVRCEDGSVLVFRRRKKTKTFRNVRFAKASLPKRN